MQKSDFETKETNCATPNQEMCASNAQDAPRTHPVKTQASHKSGYYAGQTEQDIEDQFDNMPV